MAANTDNEKKIVEAIVNRMGEPRTPFAQIQHVRLMEGSGRAYVVVEPIAGSKLPPCRVKSLTVRMNKQIKSMFWRNPFVGEFRKGKNIIVLQPDPIHKIGKQVEKMLQKRRAA